MIWYHKQKLYRPCAKYDRSIKVTAGFTYVDEECNCIEKFPYRFGAGFAFSPVHFEKNRAVLGGSYYASLNATAAELKKSNKRITLSGYTAGEGRTAMESQTLARERASSVKLFLINAGVESQLIRVAAYGESHPIADNSTEEGRIMNRRVEFKVQ